MASSIFSYSAILVVLKSFPRTLSYDKLQDNLFPSFASEETSYNSNLDKSN